MKKRGHKYIIGVDEVGRGPLAGPVAIGVVRLKVEQVKYKKEWALGFRDSKKLSPKAREEWLVKIEEARSEGWLEYAVAFVAPSVIDKKGITHAIRTALSRALKKVDPAPDLVKSPTGLFQHSTFDIPYSARILLDGGLRAPAHYTNQQTIIRGDEKELVIALASIVAKVTRDRRMVALAKKFPAYGFEKHKGYGTRAHYEAIKKHGIIPHHRKSFLK
ncbi:MAG: ribonuclease HII [Patescibacteria group bacterium]